MSELTSHLRTVHFTLIVTCAVVYLSVAGAFGDRLGRAQQQLRYGQNIAKEWGVWLPKWAADVQQQFVATGAWPRVDAPSVLEVCGEPDLGPMSLELRGSPVRFDVTSPRGRLPLIAGVNKVDGSFRFYAWHDRSKLEITTLASFRQFWEEAESVELTPVSKVGGEPHYVASDGMDRQLRLGKPGCMRVGGGSVNLELHENNARACPPARDLGQLLGTFRGFCTEPTSDDHVWIVPVELGAPLRVSGLRRWLARYFGFETASRGYEKDFPDLAAATVFYEPESIDKVAAALDADSSRSSEHVQLFGLTLPVNTVITSGAVLVMLVQLYFLIHLGRSASEQLDPGAAWIGLYDDWLSRVVTNATALVLPVVVVAFTQYRQVSWPIRLAWILPSVILAWRSVRQLNRLPATARSRKQQPRTLGVEE